MAQEGHLTTYDDDMLNLTRRTSILSKVFSTGPTQWWLTFAGQTIVAISQIFILGIPAQVLFSYGSLFLCVSVFFGGRKCL